MGGLVSIAEARKSIVGTYRNKRAKRETAWPGWGSAWPGSGPRSQDLRSPLSRTCFGGPRPPHAGEDVVRPLLRPKSGRAVALAGIVALMLAVVPSAALAVRTPSSVKAKPRAEANAAREKTRFFDSRQSAGALKVLDARAARLDARPSAGVAALRTSLG